MAQVKFVVDEELLNRFERAVIERRGKIEFAPEVEEALRLYIEKYEGKRGAGDDGGRDDPLIAAIGAVSTEKKKDGERRSALLDLKELEAHP